MKHIFEKANYNFVKWRWHAIALSWLIVLAGVVVAFSRGGVPRGIDFTGGTAVVVKFNQPIHEDAVRSALDPITTDKVVQSYGPATDNSVLIRMPIVQGMEEGATLDQGVKAITDALTKANIGTFTIISTDVVGPVIGRDLQLKGVYATLASLAGILIYIWLRFEWMFAVGA